MQISNRTVLITGGATGIGYAMAEAFLAAGSKVAICGRRKKRLDEARARHPKLLCYVCDVSDENDRRGLVEWAASELPGLNTLINNAGVQRDIDLSAGLDEFLAGENEIRINLESVVVLTGLFAPHLAKMGDGAIIYVSSGLGFVPAAKMPVYCASKAGIHAFAMAMRWQLKRVGVKVFEVIPPAVDTELNPAGRAKRGNFKAGLDARTFVSAMMEGLRRDAAEIGCGMTEDFLHASRDELNERFERMNASM